MQILGREFKIFWGGGVSPWKQYWLQGLFIIEVQSFVYINYSWSFSFTYRWCLFSISVTALSAVPDVILVTVILIVYNNYYNYPGIQCFYEH